MKFSLKTQFNFSGEITNIHKEIHEIIEKFNHTIKEKNAEILNINFEQNQLIFDIKSDGEYRPHNSLLQIKNNL